MALCVWIAFLCWNVRTQWMDWMEMKVELMPAALCSYYHSVCVCVCVCLITVCHCYGAWLPPADTPFILQTQNIEQTSVLYTSHIFKKQKKHNTMCQMHHIRSHNTHSSGWHGEMSTVWCPPISGHFLFVCLFVCVLRHDLYIVLSPPLPWPLNLSLSHASIFTPLACRKKRWKSLG